MLIHEQACSKTPSRCLTPLFVYSNPDDDCLHPFPCHARSEEHTSELQSQSNLVCRLLLEKKTANQFSARLRRYILDLQRCVRGGAGLCDVFLLGLERGSLHHRRNQEAGKKCSPITLGRYEHRDRDLRAAQCHLPRHHAHWRAEQPTRSSVDRRQTYFRLRWWPHRWGSHLPRLDFLNQLNDVDWAEGQHVDGRRSLAASFAWPQES